MLMSTLQALAGANRCNFQFPRSSTQRWWSRNRWRAVFRDKRSDNPTNSVFRGRNAEWLRMALFSSQCRCHHEYASVRPDRKAELYCKLDNGKMEVELESHESTCKWLSILCLNDRRLPLIFSSPLISDSDNGKTTTAANGTRLSQQLFCHCLSMMENLHEYYCWAAYPPLCACSSRRGRAILTISLGWELYDKLCGDESDDLSGEDTASSWSQNGVVLAGLHFRSCKNHDVVKFI